MSPNNLHLVKILLVILPEFPHDDPAECWIVDQTIDLNLVDQVLDLSLGGIQAEFLHCHSQVLCETSAFLVVYRDIKLEKKEILKNQRETPGTA